jgi:V8-like Glu-specific endopeptidase
MQLSVSSRRSLIAGALLVGANIMFGSVTHAQDFKTPLEYAKDETRRVLRDSISQAENALRALDAPRPSSQLRQRQSPGTPGQPRIVNGVGSFRYSAAGALLKGNDPASAGLYCSGTLVACDKFLVAAHCIVEDPDPGQYHVYFQHAGFFKATTLAWQRDIYRYPNSTADLAVVTLDRPVAGIAPERVNFSAKPAYGTLGTIVGFGRTGGDRKDYGLKREGYVKTARCTGERSNDTLICWNFDTLVQSGARRSNTCNADSGGPLFVNSSGNEEADRSIAGVTGGGDASSHCLVGDHAYDTNLYEYRTWLQSAGVPAAPASACGAQGNVDVNRHVIGATFMLNERNTQNTRTIEIGSDTKQLMVAMNAEDNGEGSNDFDLYLVPGREADLTRAVCKENGAGQFAFCTVSPPRPGPWTIVTRRKIGVGAGQIVVTRLPKNSQ